MRSYLTVVLTCISLIISDVKHLFILTICMSSLEKILFRSFAHFTVRFFGYFTTELYTLLIFFWILTPYQVHGLQIFSPILQVAFHFVAIHDPSEDSIQCLVY